MPSQVVSILTQLIGAREVVAGVEAEALALRSLAKQATIAGVAGVSAGRQFNVANQALFTLRRITYGATLAMGAAGIAALHMGASYDLAMQEAEVALAPVLTGSGELADEMNRLFRIAAYTPFQFKDVTVAFRSMYAALHPIGYTARDTETTIQDLTDALSFAGRVTPAALQRVAIAMQHLAFQGHLTGHAVNQLSRDGIPMLPILRNQFHLTGEEIHKVGTLGIPVQDVLKAIHDYIQNTPGYAGAAARQASSTLVGVWSTFKDLLSQALGGTLGGTQGGMIHGVQMFLKSVNDQLKGFSASHPITLQEFVGAIDKVLSPKTHAVMQVFDFFKGVIDGIRISVGGTLFVVWKFTAALAWLHIIGGRNRRMFQLLGGVVGGFIGILTVYKTATFIAAFATNTWKAALWGLRTAILATRLVLVIFDAVLLGTQLLMSALGLATAAAVIQAWRLWLAAVMNTEGVGLWAAATGAAGLAMWTLNAAVVWATGLFDALTAALTWDNANMLLLEIQTYATTIATTAWAIVTGIAAGVLDLLVIGIGMATVAFEIFTAAILANPIGIIGTAIVLLIAILPLLYWKWSAFHKLVDRTYHWIVGHWRLLADVLLGPFVGPLILIVTHWNRLWHTVRAIFHKMISLATRVASLFKRIWDHIPGHGVIAGVVHHIPFLAEGGQVMAPGLAMVGERGPELVALPSGASVVPNREMSGFQMPNFPNEIHLTAVFNVDGKKMAKVVQKHKLDSLARA